jgi:peptidoglycan/xylan/chitin deacetylase (PgdA/CDA1 family)
MSQSARGATAARPAEEHRWRLPVLRYHSVPHHSPETAAPGSVPASVLEEQLTALRTAGWQLLGITEALRAIGGGRTRRVVALTFDDGLLDFLNAFEILQGLGARATLYIPTSTVGVRVSRWDRGHSRLGWDEIGHLGEAGVEIGSQSVHNRSLAARSTSVVRDEVLQSRRLLEDRLAVPITSFCYPLGDTSARVRRAVADAGYANGCTADPRTATSADDVLDLPRIRVRGRLSHGKIGDLVTGDTGGTAVSVTRIALPAWRRARRTALRALHTVSPRC